MYFVHILAICPVSHATNSDESQLMRVRHCRYTVTQLLLLLSCHSWRSMDCTDVSIHPLVPLPTFPREHRPTCIS